MQKTKRRSATYTIEAPNSARTSKQHNKHDHIATTKSKESASNPCTSRAKTHKLSQAPQSNDELVSEPSDLNTSGANSTIYECVKMLGNEDHSFINEDSELLNSTLSKHLQDSEHKRNKSSGLRMVRREDFENLLALQQFKSRKSKPEVSGSIKELSELIKTSSPKKKDREAEAKKEKTKELGRNVPHITGKVVNPKDSSKQSISKIAGSSFSNNQKNSTSNCTSGNVTARKNLGELSHRSKGSENGGLSSRLMTAPQSDREVYKDLKNSLVKHLGTASSPQTTKTKEKSSTLSPDKFQIPWSHRGTETSSKQHQKEVEPHHKVHPLTISISRNVQALISPRGNHTKQKSENYKTLESIKEVIGKQPDKKTVNNKGEHKAKKDSKALKSAKVDLVQVDLTRSIKSKKEEKVDVCIEQFEEAYEKLKKAISEKKQAFLQSDSLVEVLDNLRNQMVHTKSLLKSTKTE